MNTRTRRSFIKTGILAASSALSAPYIKAGTGSKPLRTAVIGVTGRCGAHYPWLVQENVVALCDVDTKALTFVWDDYRKRGIRPALESFPNAKFYTDYRELFESQDDFDAVVICTPDVHHYPAVMRALRAGKAIYCEKPLTFTAWEAQQIAKETAKLKLPTQMGNQGMSTLGWRQAHAYYHADAIGEVREVHSWMEFNGAEEIAARTLPTSDEGDPIPETVDWDLWSGPAPRPVYKEGYFHPGNWRYWLDYGCGRFGDFACHTMNAMFKVLEPEYPSKVELLTQSKFNGDSYPAQRLIKWEFPERGDRAAFTSFWYDGGLKPPRPKQLEASREMWENGSLFIGTKGTMYVVGSHNSSAILIPESERKTFGKPELLVPEGRAHHMDFVDAAKGLLPWDAPLSNFTYGGPMTATAHMGNALVKNNLNKLDIDPATGKAIGFSEKNNPFSYNPRPGWYI